MRVVRLRVVGSACPSSTDPAREASADVSQYLRVHVPSIVQVDRRRRQLPDLMLTTPRSRFHSHNMSNPRTLNHGEFYGHLASWRTAKIPLQRLMSRRITLRQYSLYNNGFDPAVFARAVLS